MEEQLYIYTLLANLAVWIYIVRTLCWKFVYMCHANNLMYNALWMGCITACNMCNTCHRCHLQYIYKYCIHCMQVWDM